MIGVTTCYECIYLDMVLKYSKIPFKYLSTSDLDFAGDLKIKQIQVPILFYKTDSIIFLDHEKVIKRIVEDYSLFKDDKFLLFMQKRLHPFQLYNFIQSNPDIHKYCLKNFILSIHR